MLTAYRIFKTKHAKTWFDGKGAFLFGGRWNSRGIRLLYTSASLSLAALEMLVNLNSEELLLSYSFATVRFDEKHILPIEKVRKLPPNWNDSPPPLTAQSIGDEWAESEASLVLRVPTAVLPGEYNYLINVEHPEFSEIKLGETRLFRFDDRLHNRR